VSDLQTLFSRDPLSLEKKDFETIIEQFRASRHQFNLGNKMAGSTKPKTEKQQKTFDLASKIGGDLEL
jgi:hypothetical protein